MPYESLKTVVLAVSENNGINDAQWSDWTDAHSIAEIYEIEDLDADDLALLDRAIASNGATLDTDLTARELAEMGQNFEPAWWRGAA